MADSSAIRVILVDDEALTLELHRAYIDRLESFEVVAECASARDSAQLLAASPQMADLVLLDITMPDGTGLDVLRRIRARGSTIDVIAVTSVREADAVREAASLGVVQYLVKPFPFSVFAERLAQYREDRERRASGTATQAEIDALLAAGRTAQAPPTPKGLSAATLDHVAHALAASGPLSAAETGELLGLSRVAARRYLEHLVGAGVARKDARHGRAGRPENEYRRAV